MIRLGHANQYFAPLTEFAPFAIIPSCINTSFPIWLGGGELENERLRLTRKEAQKKVVNLRGRD